MLLLAPKRIFEENLIRVIFEEINDNTNVMSYEINDAINLNVHKRVEGSYNIV